VPRAVKPLLVPPPALPVGQTVLAVDLGASNVRTALVDAAGTIAHRYATRTDPADPVGSLLGCLRRTSAAAGAGPVAVAVAALGPLDLAAGALELESTLLPGAEPLPITGPVAAATALPVVLERDTVVAALGEAAYGAARGVADFLYLTVSTGIGAAVVSGGRVLTGAHGLAGEVGHLPVDPAGPACGCGLTGCLEVLAAGSGIAAAAGADARAVAAAAEAGDPAATAVLQRARAAFAATLVGLVNAYDPALVVVGGSVARGQGDLLLGPARAAVRRHAYGRAARSTPVVPAALGDDAALAGGAALAASRLEDQDTP
jgi:glucokinase